MTPRTTLTTVLLAVALAGCTSPTPPPPPTDTIPPALSGPGSLVVQADSTAGAVVTFLVEAFDVGDDAAKAVDCVPPPGALYPVGTTSVSCSAEDSAGNVGLLSFTVTVEAPPGAAAVAAGSSHACALIDDGSVRCWGLNSQLQLGTAGVVGSTPTPVVVPGVHRAVEITAGSDHTCALIDDGTVTCWGQNGGRLGNGDESAFSPPMPVVGLDGVASVSAGDAHTCAVLEDGTARCWGGNSNGQLGNGSIALSAVPVAVSGLTGALSISAGGSHTCAVRASGLTRTVRCWGANDLGQLGNGTTTASSVPVTVPGLTSTFVGPAAVAAGTVSTCALLDDGTARCWGDNRDGQLGNGSFANTAAPVLVNGLTGATSLDTRFINTCATVTGGEVRCWGANQAGQLGNGTASAPSNVAVGVTGLSDAAGVSVGSPFACALRTTGAVACWGNNDFGRLGDGSGTDSPVPVPVAAVP